MGWINSEEIQNHLVKAAMDGDEETFFQLLDSGDDCNAVEISRNKSLDKYTCLHVLCSGSRSGEKYLRLLRRLLKSPGILLNPVNSMGDTPLITASYYGDLSPYPCPSSYSNFLRAAHQVAWMQLSCC